MAYPRIGCIDMEHVGDEEQRVPMLLLLNEGSWNWTLSDERL